MPQNRIPTRRTLWNKEYTKQLENLGILLCVTFLVFLSMNYNQTVADNSRAYYQNWHNLDLIFNIQNIANTINNAHLYTENGTPVYMPFDKISDTGGDFISRPLTEYYIPSMNGIDEEYNKSLKDLNKYFVWGLLDILLLGILLGRKL